ncbi:NAC domain-containing protein JA2L-like [Salvia splendens]|uniref:NAC domain-containing protein JA2L-like n=1 Tax=Salvia splendens TaxID=180675 RepID=UPI001C275479|nr:NAC domain-containing protein JA2L-like [Salvia splendens]
MDELPPGRVFNPSDEEIIREYLTRKNNEEGFHTNMIHTVNFYDFDPDYLSGIHGASGNGVWYFFTKRKRSNRPITVVDRRAGNGDWKVVDVVKDIMHDGRRIGARSSFAYFTGPYRKTVRTDWMMREFTAPEIEVRFDDWVVCKMYEYKSISKRGNCSSIPDVVNEAGSSRKRNHDGEEKDGKAQHKRRVNSATATATASAR